VLLQSTNHPKIPNNTHVLAMNISLRNCNLIFMNIATFLPVCTQCRLARLYICVDTTKRRPQDWFPRQAQLCSLYHSRVRSLSADSYSCKKSIQQEHLEIGKKVKIELIRKKCSLVIRISIHIFVRPKIKHEWGVVVPFGFPISVEWGL
jgi:hypothetical protein